ncbi:MAG: glycosyltransferase [Candidatus Babeliales bacterium]
MGGAERALCALLENMRDSAIQHHVAYFHAGPCVAIMASLGIPTYPVGGLIHRYDPLLYYRLYRLVKKINPDVIHTSLWSANILGRIIGTRCGIPVVSDLHGNCEHEGWLRNSIDRRTAHLSQRTIAVATTVENSYRCHIVAKIKNIERKKLTDGRVIVIKNGINAHKLRAQIVARPLTRRKCAIAEDAFVIGSVGRLEPIKSYDILIRAFALLCSSISLTRPLTLVLVGGGSQMQTLKNLAQSLDIAAHVLFTGEQPDAWRFYQLFDCFALSSQSEGISLALLEALCCGIPVATTHAYERHDVITDKVHGFLVPPGDIRALARALEELYNHPEKAITMGTAARQLIDEKFTIERVVEQYRDLFKTAYKNFMQRDLL